MLAHGTCAGCKCNKRSMSGESWPTKYVAGTGCPAAGPQTWEAQHSHRWYLNALHVNDCVRPLVHMHSRYSSVQVKSKGHLHNFAVVWKHVQACFARCSTLSSVQWLPETTFQATTYNLILQPKLHCLRVAGSANKPDGYTVDVLAIVLQGKSDLHNSGHLES